MLRLLRPLFWLKYCTKDRLQTFKTRSSISSQTGCPYDPLSGRLSNIGVDLLGGTESQLWLFPSWKSHCQSGKVMFDSNPNNNFPGFCNRLHCRSTKPPTGESCKGEIPLLEGKGISNYACSSNSKCTRHSRFVPPSNLASSPSLSILANQIDPSSTFEQPELRCAKVRSKEPVPQGGMPENGQHNGGSPIEQQRRYPFSLPLNTQIGTLAMVPGEEHHDISSARTWQVEHHSRFGIEGVQRQQRVEDRPSNVFPLSQGVRNRPVCFLPVRPASRVRQLAPRPRGSTRRCVDNGLGTLQGLRLSTFQSDPSCPKQSVSRQSGFHISDTHLASITMVATATEPPDRVFSPPAELQTPPEGPSRPSENSSNVPQTALSRVSCLRGQ